MTLCRSSQTRISCVRSSLRAIPSPLLEGLSQALLVSCPIAVHSATSSAERVAFRQINRETGNRLKQQLVDEETGDVVSGDEKGRGFEVGCHDYMLVEDEEVDAVAIESSHTIDIDRFVPRAQIDERYLDSPYYIVPEGKVIQDAFAVIREAMRGKDLVALGRIVVAKRERVVMLQAWDKGILATTLRYAYEVRDAASYFGDIADIEVPADMLKLAEHILETKAGDFDPPSFMDRYDEALVSMLRAKQVGSLRSEKPADAEPSRNVINLMEPLRKSLKGAEAAPKPKDVLKPKKAKKRVEGQREMLLPIAGKGPPKEAAKKPRATTSRKAG